MKTNLAQLFNCLIFLPRIFEHFNEFSPTEKSIPQTSKALSQKHDVPIEQKFCVHIFMRFHFAAVTVCSKLNKFPSITSNLAYRKYALHIYIYI